MCFVLACNTGLATILINLDYHIILKENQYSLYVTLKVKTGAKQVLQQHWKELGTLPQYLSKKLPSVWLNARILN